MDLFDAFSPIEIEVKDLQEAEQQLHRLVPAASASQIPLQEVVLKIPENVGYTTDELFLWYESRATKIAGLQMNGLAALETNFDVAEFFEASRLIFERSQRGPKGGEIRYSMVACFKPGREATLKKFLESLEALSYAKENWELILMIDGDYVLPLDVESSLSRVPVLRVFAVTRSNKTDFRVGSLRNLGATLARGSFLIFSDSDFWISPLLLKSLDRAMTGDALWIQPLRQQNSKWMTVLEGKHWRQFRDEHFDWNQSKHPWLWGSSYCFCVPKDTFLQLGGFSRYFDSYGYEDTELAYRWTLNHGQFQKLRLPVLHLEVGPRALLKKIRLKLWGSRRSAERFYRLYLDREIYATLFPWMGATPPARFLMKKISSLPQILWKAPVAWANRLLNSSPKAVVMTVKSRSQWTFARLPAGTLSRVKWSFAKGWLAKAWYFYRFHYERNYQRLWKEEPTPVKKVPVREVELSENLGSHEPRV